MTAAADISGIAPDDSEIEDQDALPPAPVELGDSLTATGVTQILGAIEQGDPQAAELTA